MEIKKLTFFCNLFLLVGVDIRKEREFNFSIK